MRMVVKINNVLILYWKNVFSLSAYCFINPDIELGIWLCSHWDRLPNPIEDEIYEKFKEKKTKQKKNDMHNPTPTPRGNKRQELRLSGTQT